MNILLQAIAVMAGFLVQTVFGFAASLIAYPILLLQLSLPEAVALMSIFYVLFSLIEVKRNWEIIDRKIIKEMLAGIIPGLIIGVIVLKYADPQILKKALGIFIILFVAYSFLKRRKIELFKKLGTIFGFAGGLFSGLFATGGPFLVVYVYNKLDDSNKIRATLIGGLAIVNFLRAPLLVGERILTKDIFVSALYSLPFFLLSIYIGQKLYSKLNDETFKKVLLILLGLIGINLLR